MRGELLSTYRMKPIRQTGNPGCEGLRQLLRPNQLQSLQGLVLIVVSPFLVLITLCTPQSLSDNSVATGVKVQG